MFEVKKLKDMSKGEFELKELKATKRIFLMKIIRDRSKWGLSLSLEKLIVLYF